MTLPSRVPSALPPQVEALVGASRTLRVLFVGWDPRSEGVLRALRARAARVEAYCVLEREEDLVPVATAYDAVAIHARHARGRLEDELPENVDLVLFAASGRGLVAAEELPERAVRLDVG